MSSLNLAGVFTDALHEHIHTIRQLESQQDAFERAAILITDSLLRGLMGRSTSLTLRANERLCLSRSPGYLKQNDLRCRIGARYRLGSR